MMTEEQMRQAGEARKERSIRRLRGEGVPVIEHLPWIECDPGEVRGTEEIARRVMVVALLAVYAEPEGMPRDVLEKYLEARGVKEELTQQERDFLAIASPSERERSRFSWQYECAHVLLWGLGFVERLGMPTEYCTAAGVSGIVARRTVEQLVGDGKMRTAEELFDETDLIYRYHWAARNAGLKGETPEAGLIEPVCYYRHYALNWMTHRGWGWDEVDTST